MKKLILVLAMLLLLPGVLAFTVELQPVAVYETNTAGINVSVDNFLGADVISDVLLNTGVLSVDSVQAFAGWYNTFSASQVHWYGGTIETNIAKALFVFTSTLPKVDADSEVNLTGTMTYSDTSTTDFTVSLTILNDATPPVVNSYSPQNYARANTADHAITVNTSDPETGIESATYSFNDCSGNSTAIALICADGICTGTADFSEFDEGDSACFEIIVKNNAGDSTTITGTLGFDATPPVVTLVSPVSNAYAGPGALFTFNAADNLASTLECSVLINSDVVYTAAVANGADESFTPNLTGLTEDVQAWQVRCDDEVGLSTITADSFTYDETPPVITLNSPSNGSIVGNTFIDISVTDNKEVDSIVYSQSLDTSGWAEGINTVTVTATDKAGNSASAEFTFYADRTAPTITVLSPVNDSTFDYNAVFTVRVEDNYDTAIDCTVTTDVSSTAASTVTAGVDSDINLVLPLGSFTWYVTCSDDAANSASSDTYYGTAVDMSGPTISLTDRRYVVRGHDLNVDAQITDISGVDYASATFGTDTISLNGLGDDYTGTFSIDSNASLGNYTYSVFANDSHGYTSTESDAFEVIEGYVITINMPSSVTPGASVSLTGSVLQDDGAIPAGDITIDYTSGNATVTIDSSGGFSYTFTAPSTDGTYIVKVYYETERFIYTKTKSYSVATPSSSGTSGGGGYEGYTISVEGAGTTPTVQEDGSNSELQTEASASELVTQDEETQVIEKEIAPSEPRSPIAGQATGVLSALGNAVKWWVLLLALVALAGGLYFANRKLRKPGSGGKIDWSDYFD